MKIDITIKDVSVDEAYSILDKITGQATVTATPSLPILPAAPTAPVSPAATVGNLPVEAPAGVDSNGLPWDERIHSSSKKTTANGSWVRRKNVDESFFNQVVAELRARGGNVAAAAIQPGFASANAHLTQPSAPAIPPMPANELPPFLASTAGALPPAVPAYTPPPMPPAQPAYAPPAAPAQHSQPAQVGGQTITDLFNKIQQMFQSNTADANYINSLTSRLSQRFSVQVTSINDIAGRPDMIADAFALIASDGK